MISQLKAVKDSTTHRPAKVLRHPFLQAIEGTVQVFTSVHRSFFTNVMVQALRAADQGMSVLVVQFLKGGIQQGPEHATQMGQNLDWVRCGYPGSITESTTDSAAQEAVAELWDYTQQAVRQGNYGLIVLDELSLAIEYGFLAEAEVLKLLEERPPQSDMLLTGPQMPYSILSVADQVTEIRRSFMH